jgi:hypothetical protein
MSTECQKFDEIFNDTYDYDETDKTVQKNKIIRMCAMERAKQKLINEGYPILNIDYATKCSKRNAASISENEQKICAALNQETQAQETLLRTESEQKRSDESVKQSIYYDDGKEVVTFDPNTHHPFDTTSMKVYANHHLTKSQSQQPGSRRTLLSYIFGGQDGGKKRRKLQSKKKKNKSKKTKTKSRSPRSSS